MSRFVSAIAGTPRARSLVTTLPKSSWQELSSASGEHAGGACGLFDEANNRFIVAFGAALQNGSLAGTNRVSAIEFK